MPKQKVTQEAFGQSEEVVRLLLNSTGEGICGLDLEGLCTFCNPACARLLGYDSPDDLIGKNMHNLIHHTGADGIPIPLHDCQIYQALCKGEAIQRGDEILWRRDGTHFSAEYSSYPVRRAGEVIGSVVSFVDITGRKQAEQALQASNKRYQQLFDNNPEAMFVYDLESLAFLAVNDAFVSCYGWSREEFMRMTVRDIRKPSEVPALMKYLSEAASVFKNVGVWNHTKKGGDRIEVETTSYLIEWNGRPARVAYARDVTEKKRTDQQLRQAQKMEAVGRLAGGIAHDFNNLLGVIIGYTEILQESLSGDAQLSRKASAIKKAGLHAASLTRQLLAFSRKQVLDPRVLNLNAVVTDTLKMLQRLIGENIEASMVLASELGSIKADQSQIEQIIINLALNARDAMPRGGKLTITTANADLGSQSARHHPEVIPGSYVLLTVSDTGSGMSAETQSHIFEPFFTTKEMGNGTGLGLATVYGVVKQSGGFIWVYSELGRGTTFKVYLPGVFDVAVTPDPDKSRKKIARGSETVLVVEDAQPLRELARELLEGSGYTVLEAANGIDAVQLVEQHQGPIHLLLTDVIMPGMDGRRLAESLAPRRPEMKVLYMSGYPDEAIVRHGILEPGIALLQKPFTAEALTRSVRKVLDAEEKKKA
jgi:PAS domain S-box-containing protein